MRAVFAALALIVVVAGSPRAEGLEEVIRLHEAGDYLAAAERGRELDTAEALARAANALAIHGYFIAPPGERAGFFRQAHGLAERAREQAEAAGVADKRLLGYIAFQEGQALGRLAEVLPMDERLDYADPVHEAFEAALALDAERWEAHVGLARWHAQSMLVADDEAGGIGAFFANVFVGASYEEAEVHRAAAVAIEKSQPERKAAWFESAEIRLLIDPEENRTAAKAELERSLAIAPSNALTRTLDGLAGACLEDISACNARIRARLLE
ncbi:MAG: hypothetical protein MI920_35010 [Kiloniellales bacterium]|nr:hypothetical protein [Kiloniellales bacterium]